LFITTIRRRGYVASTNGGAAWTAGKKIAGPMKLAWQPVSDNGPMVADYIGVSYVNGNPFGVFASAQALTGSMHAEAMYTAKTALLVAGSEPTLSGLTDKPVAGAKSDHVMHFYYDDEGTREIPRSRWVVNTSGQ
jgi:hypothetical protein